MNFFITDNEGLHFLTLVDFAFLQQAYLEGFQAVAQAFMPSGTPGCILSGCELDEDGLGNYALSPGFVYWEGEIFFVPQATGTYYLGEIPVLEISEGYLATDPVTYANGNENYVHQTRILEFSFAGSLPAGAIPYEDIDLMEDTLKDKLGIADHEERIATLEETVDVDHEDRIAQLEEDLAAAEQDILGLSQDLSTLEDELLNTQNDLATAEDKIADLQGKVVPLYAIVMTDDTSNFDATGLGKANTDWEGWALCNGNYGTPDLRGQFVVGMDPANPDYAAPGYTGGEEAVQLTMDQMPRHNHALDESYLRVLKNDGTGTVGSIDNDNSLAEPNLTSSSIIINEGGDQPHENRPPFFTLAFAQKIY